VTAVPNMNDATRQKYAIPPLPGYLRGEANLYAWMVTLNDEYTAQPDQARYQEALVHEGVHFMHAITTSYVYLKACSFFKEIQEIRRKIISTPDPIKLPAPIESRISAILATMAQKSIRLTTPSIPGVSALDLMEGTAVLVASHTCEPHLNYKAFMEMLGEKYSSQRQYCDAYLLADHYLGESSFDLFPVLSFLSLCTEDPGLSFCRYIELVGKSGLLNVRMRLYASDVLHLGQQNGIECVTAVEASIENEHPILKPYIEQYRAEKRKFPLIEFGSRPYEWRHLDVHRLMTPLVINFKPQFCSGI
jgi:hypothetical protein